MAKMKDFQKKEIEKKKGFKISDYQETQFTKSEKIKAKIGIYVLLASVLWFLIIGFIETVKMIANLIY